MTRMLSNVPLIFVVSIAMAVYMATICIESCLAWSPETNHCAQNRPAMDFEGRRNVIGQILGISSMYFGGIPSPAVASSTTDDLRRIYNEGAESYESVYTESIVSKALDFSTLRTNLLTRASGDVLELGVGTGLNLPHYPVRSTITSYTALDLSTKMMELAKGRFASGAPQVSPSLEGLYRDQKVRFEEGDVSNLEDIFGGTPKFDTVIDTFSLCVFPEPSRALEQAKAVLKPGGKLLLLEHQDSLVSKTLSPTRNTDVSGTCRYDDNVRDLVKNAGFTIDSSTNLAGGFLVELVAIKQ